MTPALADGFDNTGKSYLDPYESFTILSFTSLTGTFDASEFNLTYWQLRQPQGGLESLTSSAPTSSSTPSSSPSQAPQLY